MNLEYKTIKLKRDRRELWHVAIHSNISIIGDPERESKHQSDHTWFSLLSNFKDEVKDRSFSTCGSRPLWGIYCPSPRGLLSNIPQVRYVYYSL